MSPLDFSDFWTQAEKHGPDAEGLVLARTREILLDLIIHAQKKLLRIPGAEWLPAFMEFRFKNGARLRFRTTVDLEEHRLSGMTFSFVIVHGDLTNNQLQMLHTIYRSSLHRLGDAKIGSLAPQS